jgi:hypothetical protein
VTDRILFDRRFVVTVDTIEFETLDFEATIEKTLKPEPNTCELVVYNLTEEHQAQLELLQQNVAGKRSKSGTSAQTRATKGIPCRIEAGYASGTSLVWLGDLRTAQSVLDDATWVTTLKSGDGEKAWQNARLHVSFGPRTSLDTALRAIVRSLGIGEGNISKFTQRLKMAGSAIFPSGAVLSGSTSRQLLDFARSAGLEASIQDGALQLLDRGKALPAEAVRLTPETGLIGSPTVDNQGILTAQTLMIPDIVCGCLVVVEAERIKGNYRVEKVTWSFDRAGTDWGCEIQASRY